MDIEEGEVFEKEETKPTEEIEVINGKRDASVSPKKESKKQSIQKSNSSSHSSDKNKKQKHKDKKKKHSKKKDKKKSKDTKHKKDKKNKRSKSRHRSRSDSRKSRKKQDRRSSHQKKLKKESSSISRSRMRDNQEKEEKEEKRQEKQQNEKEFRRVESYYGKKQEQKRQQNNNPQEKVEAAIETITQEELNQNQELEKSLAKFGKVRDVQQEVEERRKKRLELYKSLNIEVQQENVQEAAQNETEEKSDEDKEEEVQPVPVVDEERSKYLRYIHQLRDQTHETKQEDLKEIEEREQQNQKKQKQKDMFDMFADSPDEFQGDLSKNIFNQNVLEYDDDQQYYKIRIGEILHTKYKVETKLGRGVFGNVCKALNLQNNTYVAIKIVRNDPIMLRAGEREREILTRLNENDKLDKKHIIRLLDSFDHKKHLCLVFEIMEMDLRETLKVFGKNIGLNIDAVRNYARQIFTALVFIKKNRLIHSDLKPDNILVSNKAKACKICDFGSAFPVEENTITDQLVAPYYRAPEIILGCTYDYGIDIWSIACSLFEIYTGKFLFPGRNNNEMLKLFMQTKGKFNNRILKKGAFTNQHFDSNFIFLSNEIDPVTKKEYIKPLQISEKPIRDLGVMLQAVEGEKLNERQKQTLNHFRDFLDRCLHLDPLKRMTAEKALEHPFINPKAEEGKKKVEAQLI